MNEWTDINVWSDLAQLLHLLQLSAQLCGTNQGIADHRVVESEELLTEVRRFESGTDRSRQAQFAVDFPGHGYFRIELRCEELMFIESRANGQVKLIVPQPFFLSEHVIRVEGTLLCVSTRIDCFKKSTSTTDPFAVFSFTPIELYFGFNQLLFQVGAIVELIVLVEVHARIVLIAGGIQAYKERGFIIELVCELVVKAPVAFDRSATYGIRFCSRKH